MSTASIELQKGIHAALVAAPELAATIEGRIFDRVPATAAFPYVTFGRASLFDWSTSTERGNEHLITLNVWSKAKGRKQALEIMAAVEACLEGAEPVLYGHRLIDLRLQFAETRFDEDIAVTHGLMRFRAFTERA